MKISYQEQIEDPLYPICKDETPFAKEFNKRSKEMWVDGVTPNPDFELLHTMAVEILVDDYNKRNAKKKKKVTKTK
jgi:hypothetical protein